MDHHRVSLLFLSVLLSLFWSTFGGVASITPEELRARLEKVEQVNNALIRQMMLQQMAFEDKVRTDGDSGIRAIRMQNVGNKPYMAASYTSKRRVASIHNHANNIRTVGMGEVAVAMNGVQFRTRHNDYRLYMPSTTAEDYHATEEIPFPDVPPSVLAKTTPEEQIAEMREYFRAFKLQDKDIRDYTDYFKPVISYMEGFWSSDSVNLEEGFDSDRHFIRADSWFDLHEKSRFMAYSGRKDPSENFAYLPTKFIKAVNGTPEIAQWNYRILCHPVSGEIPLDRLRAKDDLVHRMAAGMPYEGIDEISRGVRYQLSHKSSRKNNDHRRLHSRKTMMIDEVMGQIPGKNNYVGNLTDKLEGYTAKHIKGGIQNTAYYHRPYKMSVTDAMGVTAQTRGYNDQAIYMAMTSHPEVASMVYKDCNKNGQCYTVEQRWTYAIPLEIIYLTPLNNWNPYDIEYKGDARKNTDAVKSVTEGDRNGGQTVETAYNGSHSKIYYRTPFDFFAGAGENPADPADTVENYLGVLDMTGTVRNVSASGTRIHLPNIPGVGIIRTRYPLLPIYDEGSSIFKELKALEDIVMESQRFYNMFRTPPVAGSTAATSTPPTGTVPPEDAIVVTLETTLSVGAGAHKHGVFLTQDQVDYLLDGETIIVTTETVNSHEHMLEILFNADTGIFEVLLCDEMLTCGDGHQPELLLVSGTIPTLSPASSDPPPLMSPGATSAHLRMKTSTLGAAPHTHDIFLTGAQINELLTNEVLGVDSEISENHQHSLVILYSPEELYIIECDSEVADDSLYVCLDKHPDVLEVVDVTF